MIMDNKPIKWENATFLRMSEKGEPDKYLDLQIAASHQSPDFCVN
jgi:hypothetical protein